MKFQAPPSASSVTVAGVEYPVLDGAVEAPALYAADLASHGFTPAPEALAAPAAAAGAGAGAADEPAHDNIADMTRPELFAFLKGEGVATASATSTDRLRAIAQKTADDKAAAAAQAEADQAAGEAAAKAKADAEAAAAADAAKADAAAADATKAP